MNHIERLREKARDKGSYDGQKHIKLSDAEAIIKDCMAERKTERNAFKKWLTLEIIQQSITAENIEDDKMRVAAEIKHKYAKKIKAKFNTIMDKQGLE